MSNDRPIDPETGNPISLREIAAYGATIQRAGGLAPGTRYWKIVDAYHLNGRQNRGNHHVYVDMLNSDGTRRYGARSRVWYGGRSADLTVDKPANEPGCNAPMYRGNFYDLEALGLPTDKAVGFSSDHPDEEVGNTNGHHSFMVVFQEAVFEPSAVPATGWIRGTAVNGAGRVIALSGNGVNASTTAGGDGSFGFDNIAAGTYTVSVPGSAASAQVTVTAGRQTNVTLTVPADPPPPPPPADDIAELRRQVAALQAQIAALQQQLADANASRDNLGSVLTQIKQIVVNAGY